jgi:hypothetical protein
MAWNEIEATDWTLPDGRNKVKVNLMPLSLAAQQVLGRLPRIGRKVFVLTTGGATPIGAFSNSNASWTKRPASPTGPFTICAARLGAYE